MALNGQREHLNDGQKAMVAARLLPLIKTGKIRLENRHGRLSAVAGRMLGVGWRLVASARSILENWPDLAVQVADGKCELHAAERFAREQKIRKEEAAAARKSPASPTDIQLYRGDFREQLTRIPDETVSLVLTDPLYDSGALDDWAALSQISQRILKPGGFLVALAGQAHLPEQLSRLSEHLHYYWTASLKFNGPTNHQFGVGLISCQRPILVFSKPFRDGLLPKPSASTQDYLETPGPDQTWHPFGQQPETYQKLLDWYSKPGDLVADPFAGGGSVSVACKKANRRCIATEIDPVHFANMHLRIFGVLPNPPQNGQTQIFPTHCPRPSILVA